jgi:hypothetical protein
MYEWTRSCNPRGCADADDDGKGLGDDLNASKGILMLNLLSSLYMHTNYFYV